MSLGYADKLKPRKDLGGQLGAPEYYDSAADVTSMVERLAEWVQEGKCICAFTGAGISTAIGIPDFRGPVGIWTLRSKQLDVPEMKTTFTHAKPSFTHMALLALMRAGIVRYICSQNVDNLHLRSGVPRRQLAELHGNCFVERCPRCGTEYVRDFEMETVGFRMTGRRCTKPNCLGRLKDNTLDWDSALPDDELDASVACAQSADIALCLGTSLQIEPANDIPVHTRRADLFASDGCAHCGTNHWDQPDIYPLFTPGGKLIIVNLQQTPRDQHATMVIHARVDVVMALLMNKLQLQVPPYIRTDQVLVKAVTALGEDMRYAGHGEALLHQQAAAISLSYHDGRAHTDSDNRSAGWGFLVELSSVHGIECPTPMIESVALTWDHDEPSSSNCWVGDSHGSENDSRSNSHVSHVSNGASSTAGAPYTFICRGFPLTVSAIRCTLMLQLVRWADEDKRLVRIEHTVHRPCVPAECELNPPCASTTVLVPSSKVEIKAKLPTHSQDGKKLVSHSLVDANISTSNQVANIDCDRGKAAANKHSKRYNENVTQASSMQSHLLAAYPVYTDATPVSNVGQNHGVCSGPSTSSTAIDRKPGSHYVRYCMVSQRVDYDAAAIAAAFLASPPEVYLPRVNSLGFASTKNSYQHGNCSNGSTRVSRRCSDVVEGLGCGGTDEDGDSEDEAFGLQECTPKVTRSGRVSKRPRRP